MPKIFTLLFLIMPLSCFAQFTISGRVLNNADKKPISAASVFLSNATIGDATNNSGNYVLKGVGSGKYTLVVTIVGFEPFSENVVVSRGNVKLDDIFLTPEIKALKEVVIKPDPYRESNIFLFKQQFLGKSDLAQQCKILNPDALNISYDNITSILSATSDGFLDIENDALGYKIRYLLADFQYFNNPDTPKLKYKGSVLFEALKGTPAQQQKWEKARLDVYANSSMHFYRSLISDRLTEEGFKLMLYGYVPNPDRQPDTLIASRIAYYQHLLTITEGGANAIDAIKYWKKVQKQNYTIPKMVRKQYSFALNQQDVLSLTNEPGIYAMGCDSDELFVVYDKNRHFNNVGVARVNNLKVRNTNATLVTFVHPYALVDGNGVLANPYDVFYTGVWANQRVAELLPLDYQVPENVVPDVPLDSTVLKNINAKMQSYATRHIVEKAYLHFDKPYYAAGDTMYFKAYVTVGGRHTLSSISSILYVDLVSNNAIVKTLKLDLNDGVAWGDFELPDSLVDGNYRVRAYTQLMRNESQLHFFDKAITIAGKKSNNILANSDKQTITVAKPDIQFFPEGGSMVMGQRSKIAFKAIGVNGLGINVKGEVMDNDNKQVGTFASTHLGMGYFYLNPQDGKTYHVKVTYPNGTNDNFMLPIADRNRIALSVDFADSSQMALIKLTAGKDYYQQNHNKDYTLGIYSGGMLTSVICKLDTPVVSVDIFKKTLHTGIARVALFSPSGEPLCERMFFVQNYDGLKLTVSSDKPSYAQRENASIKLNAIDDEGAPATGHFSVSVTNESKVPVDENNESTIINNLLLTSDIKGYVEQPNYYFTDAGDALADLDVLMLTQGYKGFEWKRVLAGDTASMVYQPESAFEIAGKVTTLTGKSVADGKITLFSPRQKIVRDTITDSNGNFKFAGLYITDTARMILHATMKNSSSYVNIIINKPVYPAVDISDTTANKITAEQTAAIQKLYEDNHAMDKTGIVLKQVDVKGVKITHGPKLTFSANMNGAGNADFILMGDKLSPGCPTLLDCLKGRIPGVMYQDNLIYSMHTHYELSGARQPMAIIIDGQINDQRSGFNVLENINPADVYSIEVLENMAYLAVYGSEAAGGALVITTKRGGEFNDTQRKPDGTIYYTFNGFYKARTFYSPKYEVAASATKIPDVRSTIYWNPEVLTDKDGNAAFDFFNADGTGKYRITIEGVDESGNIGRRVYHYIVK